MLLVGCASAELEWYRLTAVPGRPGIARPVSLELRDVWLARYLDRSGIVRAAGGTRLVVEDGRRWAGPLDEMITQVLSRNLEQRLPGSVVTRERGAITVDPEILASVEIDRFEIDADGRAVLSARFALRQSRNHRLLKEGRVEESAVPLNPSTNARVQAQSEVLARLADRMVEALSP